MKLTTIFAAAAAGLFLTSVSCERHSWEETKKLHEPHGAHAEGHGDAHGDGAEHAAPEHGAEKAH